EAEEVIDLKESKKEESGDSEEESEEKDDLKEIEEELEIEEEKDVDDDELELITPSTRKEILKDFPELFKKHPYLEKAMYRDKAFSEIFPTVDDAKEASEAIRTLNNLDQD